MILVFLLTAFNNTTVAVMNPPYLTQKHPQSFMDIPMFFILVVTCFSTSQGDTPLRQGGRG
jgi:hypothetical protein